MAVDGTAAARWLLSQGPLQHHGACLHYVWQAYKAQGAATSRSAYDALDAWHRTEGKHYDANPPAGMPVWFGAKPGSDAGDVVISLGGGRVVATDQPRYGVVGTCTIAERAALIGRPYLGWTDHIFDQPISTPAPAGGSATHNPAPIPFTDEDDDMLTTFYATQSDGKAPDKGRVFMIFRDPRTGNLAKRHLKPKSTWEAVKAAHVAAGEKLPHISMTSTALDKIATAQ